jgi:hypothetical protein
MIQNRLSKRIGLPLMSLGSWEIFPQTSALENESPKGLAAFCCLVSESATLIKKN